VPANTSTRVTEVQDLFVWLREWNSRQAALAAHTGPAGYPVHRHLDDGPDRLAGMTVQSWRGLPLVLHLLDQAGITAPTEWRRLAEEAEQGRNARLRDHSWVEASLAAFRAPPFPPLDATHPSGRWIALLAATFPQWLEVRSGRMPQEQAWQLSWRHMAENVLAQLGRFGRRRRGPVLPPLCTHRVVRPLGLLPRSAPLARARPTVGQ
jgi:hypothetical protein